MKDATILVVSTAIPAHALNATPLARSAREAGARVLWWVPEFLADHARRIVGDGVRVSGAAGVQPSGTPSRGRAGALAEVRHLYDEVLVGTAAAQAPILAELVGREGVDLIVSDTLAFAAGVVAEASGVPWVTFGDGPLLWPDPQIPPFGTGLPVLAGAPGRHRNRHVKRVADALLFAGALDALNRLRAASGLWPVADLLTAGVSRRAHLQGCAPGFEYPRERPPSFVHFVGALGPGVGFAPPLPDDLRRGRRRGPLAVVTQGTLRADPRELVDPACAALHADGYRVAVAGVRPSRPDAGVTFLPAVDYADAFAQADVVVTNGGYTGVTTALAAGVPTVVAGATEEKADIGARLRASGAGVAIRRVRPTPGQIHRAVRRVTTDPALREGQLRLRDEFAACDTDALIRRHLAGVLGGQS